MTSTSRTSAQSGFTAIESVLGIALLVAIAAVGYLAYANHTKATGAASVQRPTSSPALTMTSAATPAQLTAAATAYCRTQSTENFARVGTIGPDGKAALFSAGNKFALINAACVTSASDEVGGGRFLLQSVGSSWVVRFVGQDIGFPSEIVKQYGVPAEDSFK